jgi:hypothetical protein
MDVPHARYSCHLHGHSEILPDAPPLFVLLTANTYVKGNMLALMASSLSYSHLREFFKHLLCTSASIVLPSLILHRASICLCMNASSVCEECDLVTWACVISEAGSIDLCVEESPVVHQSFPAAIENEHQDGRKRAHSLG